MANTDITTAQIETLRTEAGAAGDTDMAAICDQALEGDEVAVSAVRDAIAFAAAMDDED